MAVLHYYTILTHTMVLRGSRGGILPASGRHISEEASRSNVAATRFYGPDIDDTWCELTSATIYFNNPFLRSFSQRKDNDEKMVLGVLGRQSMAPNYPS